MSCEIEVAGESLTLRADRTLYWSARRSLILADPHFGKAATFRAAGVPVPGGTESALLRLSRAITETHAERLIVLGDFWHASEGRTSEVVDDLNSWRDRYESLQIDLIRGNHDRSSHPPERWADRWHGEVVEGPLVFTHYPDPRDDGLVLAGHLHPGVVLEGRGRQRLKLPCFAFSNRVGVLPAFGDMTGTARLAVVPGQRIFVIADGEVMPLQ